MTKPNAKHFFDPAIQQARFVAEQVASLDETTLTAHGAKKFASWEFSLAPEAFLKTLERFVKDDALGKAFGDGEVFAAIPEERTASVDFFKLEDGSGVAIAKINGGNDAMRKLLGKLDLSELELMPKPPVRKPDANKVEGKLAIEGQELVVEVRNVQDQAPRRPFPTQTAGAMMPIPGGNPVAIKEFLLRVWGAEQQSIPMPNAADLAPASIMAATADVFPDDKAWPEGVKVTDKLTGEDIPGPARALATFAAQLEEREGPVIDRGDLVEQFKKQRRPG